MVVEHPVSLKNTSDFRSKMGCKQHLCWLQTDYPVRKSVLSANQSKGPTIIGSAAYPTTFQSGMKPSTQRWAMFDINLCHSTSQDLTQSKSHKLSLRGRKFDKWVSIKVKSDNTRLEWENSTVIQECEIKEWASDWEVILCEMLECHMEASEY